MSVGSHTGGLVAKDQMEFSMTGGNTPYFNYGFHICQNSLEIFTHKVPIIYYI